MSKTYAIFKRELSNYFLTPVAPIFIVVFLILSAYMTFDRQSWFDRGQADLLPYFGFLPIMLLILIPALSMRLWAEERKQGTIELLLTLPVSMSQAVLGKFLAAWAFCSLVLLLSANFWFTARYLGDPDDGVILASYVGSILMAGAYLAIGSCMSALTRNQVIAFVLTIVALVINLALGTEATHEVLGSVLPNSLIEVFSSLSFLQRFQAIAKGVLDLRDVIFFASLIVFFLFANAIVLDLRKAS